MGKPAGLWMYAGFHQEAKLIAFAYDLEQEVQPRQAPQFLGAVPPEPADPGKAHLTHHLGTGKPLTR